VTALLGKKITAISCGETHTLALTNTGHLYSFGANGCGQLGQFLCEYERKRRDSFDDIVLPKMSNLNGEQYSFMSGADSEGDENSDQEKKISSDPRTNTLSTPPPLYNTEDYKIDGM
jgi:alpha-tubulin suppressor-like RCC1 family protein